MKRGQAEPEQETQNEYFESCEKQENMMSLKLSEKTVTRSNGGWWSKMQFKRASKVRLERGPVNVSRRNSLVALLRTVVAECNHGSEIAKHLRVSEEEIEVFVLNNTINKLCFIRE